MSITPSGPELVVTPLGGCGEVGLNATLLCLGNEALLIDCGVLLGLPEAPGVERAVPGFEALARPGLSLVAVVLTHGHEDHIGALPALLADYDAPVFGTPLTIALARARLEGRGRAVTESARRQARERFFPVPLGGVVRAGPFQVELVRVTHSMPDSAALLIDTPAGRVLHSGDFKLDPTPRDGLGTDLARLRAAGELGVDLLLADSTNAEVPGATTSEREVALGLAEQIAGGRGRVVVAVMASHFHRIDAVLEAARRHGRRVALLGRALEENWRFGVELGHLRAGGLDLVSPERLSLVPREELLLLTTGSQGEPHAGLARVALGKEAELACAPGDRVIVSARTIPGNELAVRKLENALARQGVEVVTDRQATVHCSGHACQEEQRELLSLVRPRHFVPVHGERTMLEAHGRTARGLGLGSVTVVEDGQSVVLGGGHLARGPALPVSRRALDAEGRALDWGDLKDRRKIGRSGLLVCSLALDAAGRLLATPAVSARGTTLPRPLLLRLGEAAAQGAEQARALMRSEVAGEVRRAMRAELRASGEQAPEIEVQVLELGSG